MAEPKLELTKTNKRKNRLALVKQRAAARTKQRIQMILDDRAAKAEEAELSKPQAKEKGKK